MNWLGNKFRLVLKKWDSFWFAPQDLFGLSLFRLLLGFTLFFMYVIRFTEVELFYFNNGLLSVEQLRHFMDSSFKPWVPLYVTSDMGNYLVHLAYILLLPLFALGLLGRRLSWIVLLLHVSLMQRNVFINYGADKIAAFWLFYLCFARHDQYLSLKNIWRRQSANSLVGTPDIMSSVAVRLIQIQLCVTYAYTGWEKLKGIQWWEGSAIWHVLGNQQFVTMDLSFLYHTPWLVAGLTYLTIIFEIYFPVMVWVKPMRPLWLILGALFHLGIAVIMDLPFFSAVMVFGYLVFIGPQTLRDKVASLQSRLPAKTATAFSRV